MKISIPPHVTAVFSIGISYIPTQLLIKTIIYENSFTVSTNKSSKRLKSVKKRPKKSDGGVILA